MKYLLLAAALACTDAAAPEPKGPEDVYRAVEVLNRELRMAYGRGEHFYITAFTLNDGAGSPQVVVVFRTVR